MEKYCLGIDFGTQSGRALLVRLDDGKEVSVSVSEYEHGVISEQLPSGQKLPANFALQHPGDYLKVLETIITDVLQQAKVKPEAVLGLGVAVTSSTILPVTKEGLPLCFLEEFENDPHSWVKLWKHHGAQREAFELNEALENNGSNLGIQFGASSAERLLPKVLEVKRQSPSVYAGADYFLEVADWLTWQLTGKLLRSAPMAGYKAMWSEETGYLTEDLLDKINPEYKEIIQDKLGGKVVPLGRAGVILPQMAKKNGVECSNYNFNRLY